LTLQVKIKFQKASVSDHLSTFHPSPLFNTGPLLSLKRVEELVAACINKLCASLANYAPIDVDKAVEWCQPKTGKELAPSRWEGVEPALTSRALIITGGTGMGKTTLIKAIRSILRAKKVRCLPCAPTAHAAKRHSETTGVEAKTIHRMLEVNPASGGFTRNESNPLACDLLVVGEASMVDVPLMARPDDHVFIHSRAVCTAENECWFHPQRLQGTAGRGPACPVVWEAGGAILVTT
jgi:hypothetical protein